MRAFVALRVLPSSVRGPVDFLALLRFAFICAVVGMIIIPFVGAASPRGQAPGNDLPTSNRRPCPSEGLADRRISTVACPLRAAAGLSDRRLRFQGTLEWRGSKRVRRGKCRGMKEMRFWK